MNEQEARILINMKDKGFVVLTNGWPDFLVIDKYVAGGIKIAFVEAKQNGDRLSKNQLAMREVFHFLGIPFYVLRDTSDVSAVKPRNITSEAIDISIEFHNILKQARQNHFTLFEEIDWFLDTIQFIAESKHHPERLEDIVAYCAAFKEYVMKAANDLLFPQRPPPTKEEEKEIWRFINEVENESHLSESDIQDREFGI